MFPKIRRLWVCFESNQKPFGKHEVGKFDLGGWVELRLSSNHSQRSHRFSEPLLMGRSLKAVDNSNIQSDFGKSTPNCTGRISKNPNVFHYDIGKPTTSVVEEAINWTSKFLGQREDVLFFRRKYLSFLTHYLLSACAC